MKKLLSLFHWLFPLSMLALLILCMVWVQNLSIPESDHQWMSIGLIGIFFVLINVWINKNPLEFMENSDHYQLVEKYSVKGKNEERH